MKKSSLVIVGMILIAVVFTSSTNKVDHANGLLIVGQTTGCSCHKGKSGTVSFSLGTPDKTIIPDTTYPITFIYNVGILNTYQFWGLDLKASKTKSKGPNYVTLAVTAGDGMVVSSGEIVHSAPIDGGATSKATGTYSYPGLTYNTTGLVVGTKVYFSYGAATAPTATATSSQVWDQVGTDTFTVVSGLPVDFISFNTIYAGGDKVNLNWETANETNSNYFEVERSFDGKTFMRIIVMAASGKGNKPTFYSTYDVTSESDGVVYYRIKEVDFDGSFKYSKVNAVKITSNLDYVNNIYPNPIRGNQTLHISYIAATNGKLNIELYNSNGKKMNGAIPEAATGENDINFKLNQSITPGIYFLTISKGNEKISQTRLSVQ